MSILPPKFKSKIGSKEPENRQKNLYGALPDVYSCLYIFCSILLVIDKAGDYAW